MCRVAQGDINKRMILVHAFSVLKPCWSAAAADGLATLQVTDPRLVAPIYAKLPKDDAYTRCCWPVLALPPSSPQGHQQRTDKGLHSQQRSNSS